MTLVATLLAACVVCAGQAPVERSTSPLKALVDAAPLGSVLKLPAGVFDGPLVVDRAITVDGSAGTIVDSHGVGDVVIVSGEGATVRGVHARDSALGMDRESAGFAVKAAKVTIEGCQVDNCLFGISVANGDGAIIRRNSIVGADLAIARRGDAIKVFQSDGVVIESNRITDSRDLVVWFSKDAIVRDNEVVNSRYGLHFMYSHSAVIEENRLSDNSVGVFLMFSQDLTLRKNFVRGCRGPSGYALGMKDMDRATIVGNVFVANRVGVFLDNSPQEVGVWNTIEGNLFAWNDIGVLSQPSVKRNAIVGNAFVENRQQVSVNSAGSMNGNDFARDGRGNHWSDYAGYDLNGDGIGELAHAPREAFGRLVDRHPLLRILAYSPAENAIDFAARAVPVFLPAPAFSDPSPLLSPPHVEVRTSSVAGGSAMAIVGFILIAVALIALAPAWRGNS